MTQRPAGQLHQQESDELAEALAWLEGVANGSLPLPSLRPPSLSDQIPPLPPRPAILRGDDDPRDRARIEALRAGRGQRRAARLSRTGRRSAIIAVSGGLLVTLGMPMIASTSSSQTTERPSAVATPAPSSSSSSAPVSTPTPTYTAPPGTLVRGTTEDGEPFAVLIPEPGPSLPAQVLLAVLSGGLGVLLLPVAEWMRRRLGLVKSSHS